MRKEEQFSLQRRHIDLRRGEIIVDAQIAQNSVARRVPMLDRPLGIVRELQRKQLSAYLFTNEDGERYSPRSNYLLKALKTAAERAGNILNLP